jgi:cell division septum initiation protein DivIVA
MFRRIKNLISPEKPVPLIFSFDQIPTWLDKQKSIRVQILSDKTATPMGTIRESKKNLEQIIQTLRAAEYNEEIHPKLKSIAKNTLPQYAKAMGTTLSKPLPEDIEGFYTAATEVLRGCINSSRGQGKYLRTVFPQEMKTVRDGIDAIGREMNAMTGTLARFREEMARIDEAKKTYRGLADIQTDIEKSIEKESRIKQRISHLKDRITQCAQELATLERDESQTILSEQRRALQVMTEERDRTIRRYSILSMTASHVLRKAEKLAHKQHRHADEAMLTRAMDMLSDHAVPDATDLAQTLAAACPIAIRMIESGEVSLKNKEERSLFLDPAGFISTIGELSETYIGQTTKCDAAERALRTHPVIARSDDLKREKTQIEMILEKEVQSCNDLNIWRKELRQSTPKLQQILEKVLRDISGGDVQLQYPHVLAPSP